MDPNAHPDMSLNGQGSKTNLIVNYLPQAMNDKELQCMFMTIGPLLSCKVMKDYKTGYSYGYGFVDFQRAEDAARAIETLNGLDVMNKKIKVSYARPPGEHIKDTNLYVAGIPREYNENQFEKLFSEYGQIIQRNILRDKATGASRGVGFVRFDTKDQAEAAIMGLNGTIPMGSTEALKIKIAEDHGKQRAAYNAGWAAGTRRDGTRSGPVAMAGSPDGLAGKFPNPSGMLSSSSSSRGGPGGPPMPGYGGVGAMRNDRPNNRYNPMSYGMYPWS